MEKISHSQIKNIGIRRGSFFSYLCIMASIYSVNNASLYTCMLWQRHIKYGQHGRSCLLTVNIRAKSKHIGK